MKRDFKGAIVLGGFESCIFRKVQCEGKKHPARTCNASHVKAMPVDDNGVAVRIICFSKRKRIGLKRYRTGPMGKWPVF